MLVKLVACDMKNRGLQLHPGLNTDPIPFNDDEQYSCGPGGIYFCDAEHAYHWYDYLQSYTDICTVTIPPNARVVKIGNKYRADCVILSAPVRFADHPMWNDAEVCRKAVEQHAYAIRFVKEQTSELCKIAIMKDSLSIAFITNVTPELCKLAVQRNGYAIQYMVNQTPKLCKLAILHDPSAIQYVKKQTSELCKLAIQQNSNAICYVNEQTPELCRLAVQKGGTYVLPYIKNENITPELTELAKSVDIDQW